MSINRSNTSLKGVHSSVAKTYYKKWVDFLLLSTSPMFFYSTSVNYHSIKMSFDK